LFCILFLSLSDCIIAHLFSFVKGFFGISANLFLFIGLYFYLSTEPGVSKFGVGSFVCGN
jgi:hypothetical protein